jgi:hypothetical protein
MYLQSMVQRIIVQLAITGIILLALGCRKDNPPGQPAPPTVVVPDLTIDDPPSFFAVMDGGAIFFQEGVGDISHTHGPFPELTDSITFLSSFVTDLSNIHAQISLVDQVFEGNSPTEEEFYGYFSPRNIPFTLHPDATSGIWILIHDPVPNLASAFVDQPTSSYFTITDMIPVDAGTNNPKVKVRAIFNCLIRHPNGGSPKTLTNGIFIGYFSRH